MVCGTSADSLTRYGQNSLQLPVMEVLCLPRNDHISLFDGGWFWGCCLGFGLFWGEGCLGLGGDGLVVF